jgi:eukaryotic-like serine/threonine-protein kinase
MTLAPGTKLGPYEIVAPLGAGGMGEVYQARDTRLDRSVAIKVLPPHLSAAPESRARFEREARAISSLNHPHICVLHDVGHTDGIDYLVMEHLEGETLAQRLERGPLPIPEALKLGIQIADALDRAHKSGIVHRDLKPGNIMLTRSGAKLLDFGLARPGLAGAPADLTQSPTMSRPLTAEGAIVGTFQYMAPEQLEGKEADARTDLFAFGAVLYEAVSGKRAFEGKSQATLIAAIIDREPAPLATIVPVVPSALDRVIRTCLAKDPDQRWQNAADLRRELTWIAENKEAPLEAAAKGSRSAGKLPWLLVGTVVGILLGILGGALLHRGPTTSGAAQLAVLTIPPTRQWHLGGPQGPSEVTLSPDGRSLAFTGTDSAGFSHIYVRLLSGLEARPIPGSEDGRLPFWSPDSRSVGFFAKQKLMKSGLSGGSPVALADAPDTRGGSWSQEGIIVFAPNRQGGLSRVSDSGGTPTQITHLDASRQEFGHRYPAFLPDGKHFLFVGVRQGGDHTTWVGSVDGSAPKEVRKGQTGSVYAAPGYLLFRDQNDVVLAQRFDVARLATLGDPVQVARDVYGTNIGYPNLAADRQGTLAMQLPERRRCRLEWRERNGIISEGAGVFDMVGLMSFSPDGKRIVTNGEAGRDLWVLDLGQGIPRRLTFTDEYKSSMVWSPDGSQVLYSTQVRQTNYEARLKNVGGGQEDTLVYHGPGLFSTPTTWSKDGRWAVISRSDSTGNQDLWILPMHGGGSPRPYLESPFTEDDGQISPDGRWLGYTSNESGHNEVYVGSFPEARAKYQISNGGGADVHWSADGRELFYRGENAMLVSVPVQTGTGFEPGIPKPLFRIPPGTVSLLPAPDGKRFLISIQDESTEESALEVILNWPELLAKKN